MKVSAERVLSISARYAKCVRQWDFKMLWLERGEAVNENDRAHLMTILVRPFIPLAVIECVCVTRGGGTLGKIPIYPLQPSCVQNVLGTCTILRTTSY